jgi:predicted aminopeptidase
VNNNSNLPTVRAALLIGLVTASTGGCYLWESAQGQFAVMSKREPIARVIGDTSTPPTLRAQLEAVTSIRNYASRVLGLPDNGSYRSYADIGRPYVVWNVVAAGEFSVDAKEWCFPVVGCVAYRGYFAQAKARSFAAELRSKGLDVSVGGVAAYSTLGHFDDPVLNTMVNWNDIELAAIVFHELTHQLLYVAGDTAFNEALATTVEEEGVRRWLLAQGRDADLAARSLQREHYVAVIDLLRRTRARLRVLYASDLDPAAMREAKREAFGAMRLAYAELKSGREDFPFESWFSGELNNAHLASVANYYDCVPGFERELAAAGGDLNAFYRRARYLAKMDQRSRDAAVCSTP